MAGEQIYGNGTNSSVGSQISTDMYYKKALIEAAKESYFGQLANVRAMPKNMGKTIKQYHYLPILDDRNINDQGIDANGVSTATNGAIASYTIKATAPAAQGGMDYYFRGQDSNATFATALAAAKVEAEGKVRSYLLQLGYNDDDVADPETYAELTTAAIADGWTFTVVDAGTLPDYGNLYGSSKDVGTISAKIPTLSETGGRVNRVGMKRIELEGTLSKFGFYDEYTKESLDFDTDAELEMHMINEMVKAANELTEDQLQIDLLNAAGVVRFTGDAISVDTLQGGTTLGAADTVTYDDLVKLSIELDNNRTPKQTTIITGSRMVDTKVVNAARYIYIGSELLPTVMRMTDYHGNKAFIPVAQYADAGNVARGEVGAVDNFRFIVVPEMMKWAGAGATVPAADVDADLFYFSATDATTMKYDVFPMLVIGEGSFTTIGFQTDGKGVKFSIKHSKPESDIAYSSDNPYGELGFMSIKWYYGFMALRSERIALIKTVAEY